MKQKILSATFVVAMAAIAGYNTYVNQNKNEMPDLALANVEALASFQEWWDSKIYDCQEVDGWEWKCMQYKDVPKEDGDWEVDFGDFEETEEVCGFFKVIELDCVSGNTIAHCWECE